MTEILDNPLIFEKKPIRNTQYAIRNTQYAILRFNHKKNNFCVNLRHLRHLRAIELLATESVKIRNFAAS